MKTRTITGIIMAIVFIPLMIIKELIIPFQILMGAASVVAALEMIKMFEKEKPFKIETKIFIVIMTLGFYLVISWFTTNLENLHILDYIGNKFIYTIFIIVIATLALSVFDESFTTSDVGKVLLTVFYVGLGASSLVILRVLGVRFITYLLLTTVLTDVFAYIFGVKFGKHKMAPKISPKKSWEGAVAGTLIATVIAGSFGLFYGRLFPSGIFNTSEYETLIDGVGTLRRLNQLGQGLIIYLLTFSLSVIGQIGDLVASKMKRTYGIKDFGNVFPGHGGVLDRFDSSFFASMFLVTVVIILSAGMVI
ncbi:MAG: phosphatidate cytidylyltransferase [Acholeplasma sp.]|nr:phosphatidate cytidylyltransferase [Acholeplasma sp.]